MGADIWQWERDHGRGSWDGKPYEYRARDLVTAWRAELLTSPGPMLRRCACELAGALGLRGAVKAMDAGT